ncbi:MAG: hypothetical protein IJJ25_00300 [Lachnospiraceae bacterium]|nr:hypothetical protein [Lachnospiraceae bacterium]MBQ6482758.1 hypothetical protein [Anaerolineaceae bacterium]
MIKVENIDVWGFAHAIRGMRNPLNSWVKSDSEFYGSIDIGPNDLDLMRRLYKARPEHRKYLRQIFVSMDITAPFYWYKEYDTYKVGTVANSCSTMHKIAAKEFTIDDFSHEHLEDLSLLEKTVAVLNEARNNYLETKDRRYWWEMIQNLPSSYNQKRTVTMNYENVISMIKQRTGHKLDEWDEFVDILKSLPYIEEIMGDN